MDNHQEEGQQRFYAAENDSGWDIFDSYGHRWLFSISSNNRSYAEAESLAQIMVQALGQTLENNPDLFDGVYDINYELLQDSGEDE